ncbi:MAG: CoA-binding protein [Candidatus Jordarchaeaceae archaeon]
MSLKSFFNPKSIVIVGASGCPGKFGNQVLKNIVEIGYRGKVFLVHPTRSDILGFPAFKSIEEIPETPETAIVLLPPDLAIDAVEKLARKGIKHIVLHSSGFSEYNNEGKERERMLVKIAKENSLRIIGPNTIGLINYGDRFATALTPVRGFKSGKVSFIGQSGGLSGGLGWWQPNDLRFNKIVHLGNTCDVSDAELLRFFAQDSSTEVIAAYFRRVNNEIVDTVKEVSKRKPVIMHCPEDRREELVRAGAICASLYSEIFELAKIFVYSPKPKGNRVAIIGPSSGAIDLALRSLEKNGLKLADLNPSTVKILKERVLNEYSRTTNPVDYWPPNHLDGEEVGNKHKMAVEALLEDDNVDVIVLVLELMKEIEFDVKKAFKKATKERLKPIVAACIQIENESYERVVSGLYELNIPMFTEVERAIKAIGALVRYYTRIQEGNPKHIGGKQDYS